MLVICDRFSSLHQWVSYSLFVCTRKLWSSLCPALVHCFMLPISNWLLVTWLHQHVQVTWHHFDWPDLFTKWTTLVPDIDLHLRGDQYNWPRNNNRFANSKDERVACIDLITLNWKTWNGINWLTLDKLMANTVFMMCSFSPTFDWPKIFQLTVQLTHVKSF